MKRIFISLLAICTAATALAQGSTRLYFGGRVFNNSFMSATDLVQLSQTHNFGTARVMGMGGAFASLGADLSSMSINPAGMGMYRRNEVSITPLVSIANASTEGTDSWGSNNRTRFAMANAGVAFNVYESASRKLTSMTIGFGMNRIADFNSRYSFQVGELFNPNSGAMIPSISECFSQQLRQIGAVPDNNGNIYYEDYDPQFWTSILGQGGYMVDYDGDWYPAYIGDNASIKRYMDVLSSGSVNEFAISLGANLNNIVYLGATIGIQSVYRKVGITYQEKYNYFDNPDGLAYINGQPLNFQLDYASMYQESKVSGSGINFKLGVVVRPVEGLRIGAAFHTPTYYSLDYTYAGNIASQRWDNAANNGAGALMNPDYSRTPVMHDEGNLSWDFVSPSRLMFGLSYTFGSLAIVSVDYQRDWYNGIRLKNSYYGREYADDLKYEFKNFFRPTNTIRAGVEVKPLKFMALRAGGGYTDSMFRGDSASSIYYDTPMAYQTYYLSGGLGFNLSRSCVLDVAYQYLSSKQTPYELFISREGNGDIHTDSGLYDTEQTRHYISMTLGFRF